MCLFGGFRQRETKENHYQTLLRKVVASKSAVSRIKACAVVESSKDLISTRPHAGQQCFALAKGPPAVKPVRLRRGAGIRHTFAGYHTQE